MTPARDGRMGEPLPCPFCGGATDIEEDERPTYDGAWVVCTGCGASGPLDCEGDASKAIAAWNTRAPNPLIEQLVETGTHALRELDCFAACVYHDDQRQEIQTFADNFRAALSAARGETGK